MTQGDSVRKQKPKLERCFDAIEHEGHVFRCLLPAGHKDWHEGVGMEGDEIIEIAWAAEGKAFKKYKNDLFETQCL
jgi:hypothetical protein